MNIEFPQQIFETF